MEGKEKYINIINKLIKQGIPKEKISRYIIALQKRYFSDEEIYYCLEDFLEDDFETGIKNPNFNLDMTIKMVEDSHVYPTMPGGKNYSKNNPIYTGYIEGLNNQA